MKCIKLKDMKIKLVEIVSFINGASRYMILKYFKQQDLLVKEFITTKLKYMKLIKSKPIY